MPVPVPRLHGRDVELGQLRAALDRATSGRLAVVTLEGDPGIGKTRLLDEALDLARARGLQVVAGRAEELERNRPFGVWADALRCVPSSPDPRRAAIAAMLRPRATAHDPITVSSDPGLQFQVVDAVVDLVEELAHPDPLVIGLDDLQWADPSSLVTLGALGRRLTRAPVALLGCLRPAPRGPELERALVTLDGAGARTQRLGELGEHAVLDLAREVLAAVPDSKLRDGLAGAGGNPLFVTELLAALTREGALPAADTRAEPGRPALPPSLRLMILRHLSFLPGDTLAALRPASILGASFSVPDLATTTARPVIDLSAALAPAITAHVLVDHGDRLRFRHDLIRDAVYADLPRSVRLGLHREAGRRLARSDAPALQVAEHLACGAGRGDPQTVAWLTRAARETAPRAPGVAAELLQRAIDVADPVDPGRDRLVAERASALWWAGRLPDAEAACRTLLDRGHDPQVEAPTRICLARTLIAQGRLPDALGELERVQSSPALTPADRARAFGWESMARGSIGDLDGAAAAADEAMAASAEAGEHVTVSLAMNSLAALAEHRGDPVRALRLIDDAVARADRSPARVGHRFPVHVTRGHILMELDRFSDARSTLEAGRRISEELGTRWTGPSVEVFLAVERFLVGEWDDAIAGLETGFALAEDTGERYSLVLGRSVRALIALHRGELRQAAEAVDRTRAELAAGGPSFRSHWTPWLRALLLDADGAVPQALATLAECWDRCARSGLAIEYPVLGPDLVRLALAAGERARAEQVADTLAELAAGPDVPAQYTGAALRCRGLLTADPEPLLAAVDAYARSGRPLELALTAEDAGAALARHGQVDAARELLERAIVAFEGLDAARDVARTEARLRELGVRRGRRGARSRPRTGWASLTPTERRVVDLVAEGLSNPQIGERLYLSRRTVQTHVGHVFTKLDLSSRAQLAAAATRERPPVGEG
ncbi:MAG: AAA family ATPase [Actinomycetia bacterium]|nr:AAA family ATPase [Actinomycetes bacterium]